MIWPLSLTMIANYERRQRPLPPELLITRSYHLIYLMMTQARHKRLPTLLLVMISNRHRNIQIESGSHHPQTKRCFLKLIDPEHIRDLMSTSTYAAVKDVRIKVDRVECVSICAAAVKGVQIVLSKKELDMMQRPALNYCATEKDVRIMLEKEECAGGTVKMPNDGASYDAASKDALVNV